MRRSCTYFLLTVAVTVCCLLMGCGVSGKTANSAATTSTTAGTAAPETTTTTTTTPTSEPTSAPETTTPDASTPDTTDTTAPDTTIPTNPFGGDIRSTLIRIYKQSGFTDKEASCVADLIVKGSNNGSLDPSQLDISKLTSAAKRCFGADGVPGGSD